MNQSIRINSLQLLSMLLVSRFFTMLVAVPNSRYTLKGSDALLPPLFSALLMAVLLLPLIFLMRKYPQRSLDQIVEQLLPKGKALILIFFSLFCLLTAIAAAGQSEYFVSTALYPDAKRTWVLLLFMLVVWYMTAMGLEAISRVSLLVCGLIVLSFALIFTGVFSEVDWLNMGALLQDSPEKLGMTTLAFLGQNTELVLLWILQPFTTKSRFQKDSMIFLLGAFVLSELISLFTSSVLGTYGETRMFPVFTLAALSGHGFFSRLDYLHIINWTFACLLRCAMYTIAAVNLLQTLIPKCGREKIALSLISIITLSALLLTGQEGGSRWFYEIFATGIPVLMAVVLLPLLLLWRSRKKVQS